LVVIADIIQLAPHTHWKL